MHIVSLSEVDLNDVLDVQRAAYVPALHEPLASFRSKLFAYPSGAMGYRDAHGLGAYVFCHPWQRDSHVPLSTDQIVIPKAPDAFYIHDLAVHPRLRGQGIASQLLNGVGNVARRENISVFCLVAVQNSEPFWAKYGFAPLRSMTYGEGVAGTLMIATAFTA